MPTLHKPKWGSSFSTSMNDNEFSSSKRCRNKKKYYVLREIVRLKWTIFLLNIMLWNKQISNYLYKTLIIFSSITSSRYSSLIKRLPSFHLVFSSLVILIFFLLLYNPKADIKRRTYFIAKLFSQLVYFIFAEFLFLKLILLFILWILPCNVSSQWIYYTTRDSNIICNSKFKMYNGELKATVLAEFCIVDKCCITMLLR